ncbi:peptidase inhibitor family I36 protein [Cellulomonas sp. DKR-3]|uniref:Peptidase inhibitor family I36 protein n=1 Tax=Cellulomonas fulva TaxID=2835530 RepID=A0ABS5TW89_9CELL|nr:peptidase inhibitor family I36 protein [Cellulomonas fulva]MBT0993357.1 peptidase inhibitor family I36 protein [Cellulomonas fulva]
MSPFLPIRANRPAVLVLLAALLALGWAAGPTSPAAAADDAVSADGGVGIASIGQCPYGHVCVWSSASFGGAFASTESRSWEATNIDTARSLRNRSVYAARVFADSDGTGSWTCIPPGAVRSSTSVAAGSMRLLVTTSC